MLRFEKPDPNKAKEKIRKVEEAKIASNEAIGAAQECLNSELFLKYRQGYEKTKKLIVEELIMLDMIETDPVRYGFAAKDIISKLRHIGSLLRGVEKESGKR